MGEAVKAVAYHALTYSGFHRVEIRTADHNLPCRKVALNCGFSLDGILREDFCVEEETLSGRKQMVRNSTCVFSLLASDKSGHTQDAL